MSPSNGGRMIRCLAASRLPFRDDSREHMLDGLQSTCSQFASWPDSRSLTKSTSKCAFQAEIIWERRMKKTSFKLQPGTASDISSILSKFPSTMGLCCYSCTCWSDGSLHSHLAVRHSTRTVIALPFCNLCDLLVGEKKPLSPPSNQWQDGTTWWSRRLDTAWLTLIHIYQCSSRPSVHLIPSWSLVLVGACSFHGPFLVSPICMWVVVLPNTRIQSWNSCIYDLAKEMIRKLICHSRMVKNKNNKKQRLERRRLFVESMQLKGYKPKPIIKFLNVAKIAELYFCCFFFWFSFWGCP